MNYKVLYRKYRPNNFSDLIGQDNIKEILINSIKTNKIAHSYIFTGPRGTGKTSTAKIFAKTINCLNNKDGTSCNECESCENSADSADIIEIDAASNNGVEEIRELRDSVKTVPYNSRYKVYIIDEVHMLSNNAWNAFLKTLEEPPSHVIFILATTDVNKIPETVMSRCQRFDFAKIDNIIMKNHLLKICDLENINIDDNSINDIVKLSDGCLRDALSYLDKISKTDGKITENNIINNFGIILDNKLEELYIAIKENNSNKINLILDDVSATGISPTNFINNLINYLVIILLNNKNKTDNKYIKELINGLNNLIMSFNSVVNPFILIKVELIANDYFPGNNFENISQEITELNLDSNQKKSESKVLEKEIVVLKSNYITEDVKKVRINNSFFEASKENKKIFCKKWDELKNNLSINDKNNILGYIENSIVEVVSNTNVLFSFINSSEALIFDEKINIIEKTYNSFSKSKYKFIALSNEEWLREKKKYINNKDNYQIYIDEKNLKINQNNSVNELAENIFGDNIIEIR